MSAARMTMAGAATWAVAGSEGVVLRTALTTSLTPRLRHFCFAAVGECVSWCALAVRSSRGCCCRGKLTLLDGLQDLLGGLVVAQRVGERNQSADGDSIRRLVADNAGIDDNITVSIDGDGAGCGVLDGVEHGGCVALALLLLLLLDTGCVDALSLLLLVLLFAPVLGHFVCDVCGWFGVGWLELSESIAITFFFSSRSFESRTEKAELFAEALDQSEHLRRQKSWHISSILLL
jgi:hypothetical protein